MKPSLLVVGEYDDRDFKPMQSAYEIYQMAEGGNLDLLDASALEQIEAIAFRGHSFLGPQILEQLPKLRMIANFGVGYDTIDVAYAVAHDIKVSNTPDILTSDVADLGIGMMIAWSRSIPGAQDWIKSGNWAKHGEYRLQRKVSGKSVGIVGLGRIGRSVAERLVPFGGEIHYYARTEKETPGWTYHSDIISLANSVDTLFICLSGGNPTAGIIDSQVIAALGPDGLLINISRGTTIDEAALLDALENKVIAGAALDVYLNEPNINPRFMSLDNVLLQPHQSSGTIETRAAMAQLQRDNLSAYFAGAPLVTPIPECV